jgi:hypothetical protein
MERGKTGEVRDGNRNFKNLILFVKINLEDNFLYLPPWQSRVKFYKSKFSTIKFSKKIRLEIREKFHFEILATFDHSKFLTV